MSVWWDKIVEFLIGTVGQSAVDAWRQRSAVDSDISILRSALLKAHLLIERSECWRLPKYKPINELLSQLKDAVYEAESVVDEFVYQGLKNEVERSSTGTIFLRNWMGNFPAAVERAFIRLDKISNELKETCDSRGIPENPNKFSKTARPITTTYLNATEVYGRDKDLKKVVSRMGVPSFGQWRITNGNLGESSDSTKKKGNVSILSIVGMGGVGKTTLAQMACNDKSVKEYFDPIVWVCVTDNFDPVRLTKEIIEGATKKACEDLTNLDALQMNLENTLNSRRFVLVLDDVWSKDWQRLLGPMKSASEGSIVLVTARSHQCVDVASSDIDSRGVINLEGLEGLIYWEFFKSCAFGSDTNLDNYSELEVLGKEICDRLKGSPLAARTIGGLLRTNRDARHWMEIRDSKMWQLKQEESDILPVLQLSYQYLPSHLKKCFSCCALYPKDFKFRKWDLTELWIMQGFINLPQQLEVHLKEPFINEAEGYIHELEQRCFFQKAANCWYSDGYVIHDLMHDVCQSITRDECLCLEDTDLRNKVVSPNIRHLSVCQVPITLEEKNKLFKNKKLLSIRVVSNSIQAINFIDNWEFTSIRSLSLSKCSMIRLPESIGNLKHLQYLDISFTSIGMLPRSFGNLYNLIYLNMKGCNSIHFLPEGFNKFANLLFLYWPVEKVKLLGRMENLAKAVEIEYMMVSVGSGEKIENLKYFNKLSGKLDIKNLENVPNKRAAEEAHLKNKPLVRELRLSWRDGNNVEYPYEYPYDQEVLEGLCPHHNLKVLKIVRYGCRTLPSWFKNEFWPNLKEIEIEHCHQLTNPWDCLEPKHFPMLKIIEISFAEKLVSLPVELFGRFVSLEELTISNCPRLTCSKAMVLPPSVKMLTLESCGDITGKSIPSCLQNLTSLESLRIEKSPELVSIPVEITSNLKSLRSFWVEDCAGLQSLGGLKFLSSLEKLNIFDCPRLSETDGRDIRDKLPSELLGKLPSESQGPETLQERSVKRARH